jgi:hypothetical protein
MRPQIDRERQKILLDPGSLRRMERDRQGIDEPGTSLARRWVSAVSAVTGTVVLAAALVACGHSADTSQESSTSSSGTTTGAPGPSNSAVARPMPSSGITATPPRGSTSRATGKPGNGHTACPTKGVGGDSVPPLCAASASPSKAHPGIQNAQAPTTAPASPTSDAPDPATTLLPPSAGSASPSTDPPS